PPKASKDQRPRFSCFEVPMQAPLSLVIFGASGDLTARKLVPALYHLFIKGRLPPEVHIVGAARSPFRDDQFRGKMADAVRGQLSRGGQQDEWERCARQLFYAPGDAAEAGGLDHLRSRLAELEGRNGGGRRLYYLAVAPDLYPGIVTRLGEAGMSREDGGWRRVIIEKPFGRDLASARAPNQTLPPHLRQEQGHRIPPHPRQEAV